MDAYPYNNNIKYPFRLLRFSLPQILRKYFFGQREHSSNCNKLKKCITLLENIVIERITKSTLSFTKESMCAHYKILCMHTSILMLLSK